ncbi:hypothetical protein BC828DRAFT_416815 [Blastocladiella britannica]|nr:hypothetical protein BC828DRAFT_416815 [Blastocladiella britannica]
MIRNRSEPMEPAAARTLAAQAILPPNEQRNREEMFSGSFVSFHSARSGRSIEGSMHSALESSGSMVAAAHAAATEQQDTNGDLPTPSGRIISSQAMTPVSEEQETSFIVQTPLVATEGPGPILQRPPPTAATGYHKVKAHVFFAYFGTAQEKPIESALPDLIPEITLKNESSVAFSGETPASDPPVEHLVDFEAPVVAPSAFGLWLEAVLTQPKHRMWTLYDFIIRFLDFFHFLVLPIQVAYSCDIGARLLFLYAALDVIFCISAVVEIRRPRTDQFGQPVIKPAEKRKFHLAQLATKFEYLALVPLDWLVLIAAYKFDASMTCLDPFYVYEHDTVQSKTPIPGLSEYATRHNYDSDDLPWVLALYSWTRAIRLLRMFRTVQWMINLKIPHVVDPISRLIKTLLFTIMFSHLDSCLFWALSTQLPVGDRWIDKYHIVADEEGILRPFGQRLSRNLYTSEKVLFFLPREVNDLAEIIFQYIEMLCAAVIYGSIFGNMASIVRSLDSQAGLDKAAKRRNFTKSHLQQYMKQFKFPPELQTKVLQQEEFDWVHKRGVNTDELFRYLPQSIREQVNYHMYYDLVSSVPIFKEHADEVIKRALCQKISIINVTTNFYVCKAGENGTEMYFLREGEVEVYPPDESRVLVTLGPGAFFGEVALFSSKLRTATIRTKTEVQLCVLKKKEFDEILSQYSHLVEVFSAEIEKRYAADRARAVALLEDARNKALERRRVTLDARSHSSFGAGLRSSAILHRRNRARKPGASSTHLSEPNSRVGSHTSVTDPALSRSSILSSGSSNFNTTALLHTRIEESPRPIRASSALHPDGEEDLQARSLHVPTTSPARGPGGG